ncbi:hypothetical protein [Streptomyces sp. SudanB182_2057]|uniref:hypothetical protein n=1 Tax=Streptomyces sp. SudanB182_2057 TaxID=3035281 RepID=UPI003F54DE8D
MTARTDFEAALLRIRELLRPGGTLVVFGEGMPVAVPRMSYGPVRATARRTLPGTRHRRHVLRRYSLSWRKPGRGGA